MVQIMLNHTRANTTVLQYYNTYAMTIDIHNNASKHSDMNPVRRRQIWHTKIHPSIHPSLLAQSWQDGTAQIIRQLLNATHTKSGRASTILLYPTLVGS